MQMKGKEEEVRYYLLNRRGNEWTRELPAREENVVLKMLLGRIYEDAIIEGRTADLEYACMYEQAMLERLEDEERRAGKAERGGSGASSGEETRR